MEGYYKLPKDYSSRPASNFIDTASYMILRGGGHVIWYLHIREIYAAQNSGINPFVLAESILRKYRRKNNET